MRSDKPGPYSRLETDDELRARFPPENRDDWKTRNYNNIALDDWAWECCQMQRRIIWVTP